MSQAPALPAVTTIKSSRRELSITFDGDYRFVLCAKLSLARKLQSLSSLELYQGPELLVRYVGPVGDAPAGRLQLMHYDWSQPRFASYWQSAIQSIPNDGSPAAALVRLGNVDYLRLLHDIAVWQHLTT